MQQFGLTREAGEWSEQLLAAAQRMKVAGARWNQENARHVAKARAAFLSGQWETLASRRKQLPLAV
jgi:hypothetical protein